MAKVQTVKIPKPYREPTSDQPEPAIVQPDFIKEADQPGEHGGKLYWFSVCHELIDGRWEPFTSMRDRTVALALVRS